MNVQATIDLGPDYLREVIDVVAEKDLLDVDSAASVVAAMQTSIERRGNVAKRSTLEELVDRITDENLHAETDTGPVVGNEVV